MILFFSLSKDCLQVTVFLRSSHWSKTWQFKCLSEDFLHKNENYIRFVLYKGFIFILLVNVNFLVGSEEYLTFIQIMVWCVTNAENRTFCWHNRYHIYSCHRVLSLVKKKIQLYLCTVRLIVCRWEEHGLAVNCPQFIALLKDFQ